MPISHLKIFPRFAIPSILATSQKGIVFESEGEKYLYFLTLTFSRIDKKTSRHFEFGIFLPHTSHTHTLTNKTLCKKELVIIFLCLSEKESYSYIVI